jgi:hypothetical protein
MSYGNYLQGSTDSTNNAYNLLISGAPSGYTTSGINIGGDTSTTYGVKITSDSTHNAFMDVRGDASNKIAFRHKDQTSGTVTSMLDLTNDSSITGSGYGATVNGRVNASSYYVGSVDTRAPTSTGVYMGTDGNVGYFNMNKGSGTGGFAFKTYNSDGSLLQSNLNLMSSGVVQASYYTATGNTDDSESVAVMGIDASGNLVRNYNINKRYRAIEARLTASESSVNGPLSAKVNEIVTRINGLNFFSQTISTLSGVTNSSPAPVSSPTPSPAPTPAPIVTTGLVLRLDAGNSTSYSGSGSTWTDTVGNASFALQNNPTYSSSNGGHFEFTTSQYAFASSGPSVSTTSTTEVWVYLTNLGANTYFVTQRVNNNSPINCMLGFPLTGPDNQIAYSFFLPNPPPYFWSSGATSLATGQWYHIVGTNNGSTLSVYVNGTLAASNNVGIQSAHNGDGAMYLMSNYVGGNPVGGKLAVVRIYNTTLSQNDITQNFNAEKSRFGL